MKRWQQAAFVGVVATCACLMAVAWANARERSLRRAELERETRLIALQLTGRMRSGLETHGIALQQLASFLEQREDATEREFDAFAAATLRHTPLCLRIPMVDPSFHVRWVHPIEQNRSLIGFDTRTHPEGYETVQRAMRTRELALSAPLTLVGGSRGFALMSPIHRRGEFLGAVACSIRSAEFFAAMVVPQVLERYDETVTDSGAPVYASSSCGEDDPSIPAAVEQFSLGWRTWRFSAKPRQDVYRAQLYSGEAAFWTLGACLAIAVGLVAGGGVYRASGMAIRLKAQGETLEQTKQHLDGAVQQLLQAEKLTALGELVAGVAHEVNNPLTAVMGYTQLSLSGELTPETRRRLETVVSEAARAARIVRNLLTFARKHPPERKHLGLNGIIEKTLELKAYHLRVNQIQVEKELAADLPKTMLDYHQIQQVILNLLNNAEQAMAENGGGMIRLITRQRRDRIEMGVSDTGPGIPAEIQRRVFEPFFTTKKDGKGTGLGLSLCYGIIEGHGGAIRLESEPGRGTTFTIDLPIVSDLANSPGDAAVASPAAGPAARMRIFVVDDEPNVQSLLVDLLGSQGYAVDTASDVPEALKKIAANTYDVVITDMKMPNGTGRDIYLGVARKDPALARRIIFTSGDGGSDETRQFVRQLGVEILPKPFALSDIERAIAATGVSQPGSA